MIHLKLNGGQAEIKGIELSYSTLATDDDNSMLMMLAYTIGVVK
tara:strand:- start:11174 stop:11305 length:132 start_codon:yes stop_codon:yes gene_type:complete